MHVSLFGVGAEQKFARRRDGRGINPLFPKWVRAKSVRFEWRLCSEWGVCVTPDEVSPRSQAALRRPDCLRTIENASS